MPALKNIDDSIKRLAIDNNSMCLRAAVAVTGRRSAELLGISPTTYSEWKDEHLERSMQVVAALGLKVVPKDEVTVTTSEMRELLKASIRQQQRRLAELPDTQPGDL